MNYQQRGGTAGADAARAECDKLCTRKRLNAALLARETCATCSPTVTASPRQRTTTDSRRYDFHRAPERKVHPQDFRKLRFPDYCDSRSRNPFSYPCMRFSGTASVGQTRKCCNRKFRNRFLRIPLCGMMAERHPQRKPTRSGPERTRKVGSFRLLTRCPPRVIIAERSALSG